MACSLPGSSVHGILHTQEYWSKLPLPSPGNQTHISCIADSFFITEPPRKPIVSITELLNSPLASKLVSSPVFSVSVSSTLIHAGAEAKSFDKMREKGKKKDVAL